MRYLSSLNKPSNHKKPLKTIEDTKECHLKTNTKTKENNFYLQITSTFVDTMCQTGRKVIKDPLNVLQNLPNMIFIFIPCRKSITKTKFIGVFMYHRMVYFRLKYYFLQKNSV